MDVLIVLRTEQNISNFIRPISNLHLAVAEKVDILSGFLVISMKSTSR